MKIKSLFQSFLPWILYFVLVGSTQKELDIAISVAAFTSIAFEMRSLRKGYVLSWGTLIFFTFLFISVVIFRSSLIAKYEWVLSNSTLALIAWVSIIIKRPFTIQYVKEQVSSEHWNSSLFIRINYILSAIWGFLFLINLSLNILHIYLPMFNGWIYELSTYIPSIVGVWVTSWFPDWYKNRYLLKQTTK
jgi:hypothetical protein